MKSPFLLFTVKCSVILYFAACTGINEYTSAVSATPHVTQGTWKVNLYIEAENDQTTDFNDCTLIFEPTGKIIADKKGKRTIGNWAEDNILNRITINLETKDPALRKLNSYWNIANITNTGLSFQNGENPSNGWLQITNL